MAKTQKISQKKWLKGVNAAASVFAQPPGSFPRASNVVYTRRGSLVTCDGTQLITTPRLTIFPPHPPASGPDNIGPLTEVFLFEPTGLPNAYYAIFKQLNVGLVGIVGLAVVDGGAGGNLSAGTYQWVVTALDGAGGETSGSAAVSILLAANHKGNLSWTALTFATGYNVYRTVANGSIFLRVNGSTPITTNVYVDNVADANLGTEIAPTRDSTQTSEFLKLTTPDYSFIGPVGLLPADFLPEKDGTAGGSGGGFGGGGGGGGGTGGSTSGGQPPTPAGGVSGNISPIPQIVQFNNQMILALGNGYPPQASNGVSMFPLLNTFVASYPARTNATVQVVGDLMALAGVLYKAIQGGTTAAAPPAFNTVLNQSTADGTVIWISQGPVNAVPAPRGAAHEIIYAGSLWVFNTSPTNTTDNFDGPSCLKMSDLNNPNSWNPLNVAFLDKDDGSQGMGLATYTIAESGIPPTGSLVAFKEFSTFQINGVFGASNFSIQRAQTDLGCVAPRSIQFVPGYGIVRMTHLGISMFDGVRDRLLSEEIRPYIFGGLPDVTGVDWNYIWFSKAALTASPPMYCCAVPVIPSMTINHLAVASVTAQVSGAATLPPGTYYLQYFIQDTQGNYWRSGEFSVVIAAGQEIVITLSAAFPTAYRGYVWYGSTPGGENTLVTLPANLAEPIAAVTNPGIASSVPFTSSGMLFRLLCYDLILKAWTIIDLPFAISVLKQFRTLGTIPITAMAGFSDGSLRRWQASDPNWDEGATVAGDPDLIVDASVQTPDVFGKDASDRVYFRQLAIRGRGNPGTIRTLTTVNGVSGSNSAAQTLAVLPMGGSEFIAYAELGITGMDAHSDISWSGPMELDSVDWLAIAKAIRGRVTV